MFYTSVDDILFYDLTVFGFKLFYSYFIMQPHEAHVMVLRSIICWETS